MYMKHKGFTVVELIVVIVVIVILAAIGIVSYSDVTDKGMDAKIRSTVKTLGDAIALKMSQPDTPAVAEGDMTVTNGADTLVPKYLNAGYRSGLTSRNAENASRILRWYSCSDNGIVVYASLNAPTDEDKSRLAQLKSSCAHSNTQVTSHFNYAQKF